MQVGTHLLAAFPAAMLLLGCGGPAAPASGTASSADRPQPSPVPQPAAGGQPVARNAIVVSFKLDPRLAGGTYGGEIWVSPSVYVGITAQNTVEARAGFIDASGSLTSISPAWIPADPTVMRVSLPRGSQVTITVERAGESDLEVTHDGFSKTLHVRATALEGWVTQVEISQ